MPQGGIGPALNYIDVATDKVTHYVVMAGLHPVPCTFCYCLRIAWLQALLLLLLCVHLLLP